MQFTSIHPESFLSSFDHLISFLSLLQTLFIYSDFLRFHHICNFFSLGSICCGNLQHFSFGSSASQRFHIWLFNESLLIYESSNIFTIFLIRFFCFLVTSDYAYQLILFPCSLFQPFNTFRKDSNINILTVLWINSLVSR